MLAGNLVENVQARLGPVRTDVAIPDAGLAANRQQYLECWIASDLRNQGVQVPIEIILIKLKEVL